MFLNIVGKNITVSVDLDHSITWNLDGRMIKSFTCIDQSGDHYTIEGNDEELNRVKVQLANKIMYRNV